MTLTGSSFLSDRRAGHCPCHCSENIHGVVFLCLGSLDSMHHQFWFLRYIDIRFFQPKSRASNRIQSICHQQKSVQSVWLVRQEFHIHFFGGVWLLFFRLLFPAFGPTWKGNFSTTVEFSNPTKLKRWLRRSGLQKTTSCFRLGQTSFLVSNFLTLISCAKLKEIEHSTNFKGGSSRKHKLLINLPKIGRSEISLKFGKFCIYQFGNLIVSQLLVGFS